MSNVKNSNDAQRGTRATNTARQVEYSQSGGLVTLLTQLKVSLAVSSYQSGLLYMIGRNTTGGLNVHEAAMPKPMGLSWQQNGQLILAGGMEILRFENILESHHERVNGCFDACFVPRTVHTTGKLDAHDVGVTADGQ